MSTSLLAHLYTHIKGSQEDIATLSLQYILSSSKSLSNSFTDMISRSLDTEIDEDINYSCQISGENQERPDMSGVDVDGNEIVVCEMKFYAGLTPNQPLGYLSRLKAAGGKGLVFVCPEARRMSLWIRLKELCVNETIVKISEFCMQVNGVRMSVVTWKWIIENLKDTAINHAPDTLSDIRQLEGFCSKMDSDAFIPFSCEDLSANVGRKIERYYSVIDTVVELLEADDTFKTSHDGLKKMAYRHAGYTRSLYIDEYTITLNYDRNLWRDEKTIETPFWFSLTDKQWKQTGNCKVYISKIPPHRKISFWGREFIALEARINATLQEVCEDIKAQIISHISQMKSFE